MRYENWDVLLFPEGSKVPIQEFKTQCFVTRDTESPYLQNPSLVNPSSYYPVQGNFGQLPVLTTFIPTQPKDSAFRLSIHNWDKPKPSRLMEGLMQPDDVLLYEARVFIDGDLVAGGVFGQRTSWPYVIELSSHIDRDGNQDSLRFPAFHREILEQSYWDAGDAHGRIRVILAEGFARPHRTPPFERVKDIIILAFQHAPLNILEYSNIAWPNPSMWSQAPRAGFKYNTGGSLADAKDADGVHGHSPVKATSSNNQPNSAVYNAWATGRAFPVPMSQQVSQAPQAWQQAYADRWGAPPRYLGHEPCIEPNFVNEAAWRHRGARSSREDIPMPDYSSSSASSRTISGNSGNSAASYEAAVTMEDDQYNILLQALTPTKPPGARTPSNTPTAKGPQLKLTVSPAGNVKGKKVKEKDNDETPKKITEEVTVVEKGKEDDAASSVC